MDDDLMEIFNCTDDESEQSIMKICIIAKFANDIIMTIQIKVPEEFYNTVNKSNEDSPIHSFDFTFGPLRVATAHRTVKSFEILKEN